MARKVQQVRYYGDTESDNDIITISKCKVSGNITCKNNRNHNIINIFNANLVLFFNILSNKLSTLFFVIYKIRL